MVNNQIDTNKMRNTFIILIYNFLYYYYESFML